MTCNGGGVGRPFRAGGS